MPSEIDMTPSSFFSATFRVYPAIMSSSMLSISYGRKLFLHLHTASLMKIYNLALTLLSLSAPQLNTNPMGPGIMNSIIALTVVFTPQIVRVAESAATQIRNMEYIDAARMSGASSLTIIRVHLLSNVVGPIFVYATSLISVCMILASGLSFLGLGVKPPEPEWGLMLNTLRPAIYTKPFLSALPGIWLFITSIAFNLLSDAFRQAMSKKS